MLTPDYMESLTFEIVALYDRLAAEIIRDIARRIADIDFATPTAALQMQRLIEAGNLYDDIIIRLETYTGISDRVLQRIFEDAGVKALRFDDSIYRAAGKAPLPLNLSPAMQHTLVAGLQKTEWHLKNMTLTTALAAQEAYIRATDLAYAEITTGVFDYNTAIRRAVTSIADEGLSVIRFPGKTDQIDVAVRRAVLTGVGQTTGQMQMMRADEMGCDLVQTTAHAGARNTGVGYENHERWQGKIYSRSGTSTKYPPFLESTGYGTGEGLLGWNCRHHFFPFFEELSPEHYEAAELKTYADKKVMVGGEKVDMYKATQVQRSIERGIRFWKRRVAAYEGAGIESAVAKAKVKEWQAKMRKFIEDSGLDRQRVRERI